MFNQRSKYGSDANEFRVQFGHCANALRCSKFTSVVFLNPAYNEFRTEIQRMRHCEPVVDPRLSNPASKDHPKRLLASFFPSLAKPTHSSLSEERLLQIMFELKPVP